MTMFGDVAVSGVGTMILTIGSAALLVGLAAWAVAVGRRTGAALDNAFTARGSRVGQAGFSAHGSQRTH
jgi:hypothetical protein